MGPIESMDSSVETTNSNSHGDHGWQKVVYPKRQRKQKPVDSNPSSGWLVPNGTVAEGDNVFRSLEQQSEDRRRRILEAQRAAAAASNGIAPARSRRRSDGYDDEDDDYNGNDAEIASGKENRKAEETKKAKPKKEKKPKVTLPEAAAKIEISDLAAFLVEVSESYAAQPEIQLMRFADYFGRALSGVAPAQFPWVKMLKESTVSKMVDIPLSHISEPVYKISVDWINQRPLEALGSFVLWALDSILTDLASQQAGAKGSKNAVQHMSSKSQVAIFVALAVVLRRKPDALISVLPTLRENPKYQGQDKLPIIVWTMVQALQGDLSVGLYSWAHNLLPTVSSKNCNPQSRDLILQLVERILSNPKARTILVNGAVRKGERLIPPSSFETLVRLTFPATSARVKATERFETIYPTVKEVALAGAPGSKAMKQVSQQIFSFALKAAGEGNPELSKEAAGIAIWALTQNVDCCKQWDKLYQNNLEASVVVLKKLVEEWKDHSLKFSPSDTLKETLKNFRQKNEKALTSGADYPQQQSVYKDAEKYCKAIIGRLSHGKGCLKSFAVAAFALAAGAALLSSNMDGSELKNIIESWDMKKFTEAFT